MYLGLFDFGGLFGRSLIWRFGCLELSCCVSS